MNRLKNLFVVIIILLCANSTIFGQETTKTDWSGDVNLLLDKILTVHPNPFRRYTSSDWYHKANQLKEHPPDNNVQAVLCLYQFLAMAADGHTEAAFTPSVLKEKWLPIIIRRFSDGWFVRTGHPQYRPLFGKPITHFEGIAIDELTEQLRMFVSFDNAIGALDGIGNLMRNAVILESLEIAHQDSVEITVRNKDGSKENVMVYSTGDAWVTPEWIDVDQELNPGQKPLYRSFERNFDFEYLSEDQIIYVWMEEIRDEEDETIRQFFF